MAVSLEPRGYVSRPRLIFGGLAGLALAMRFCRDGNRSLGHLMNRVPGEYVARACTIGKGPECWVVHCVCGATEFAAAGLVECRGACGRWFCADEEGVWCVRLPEQEADDA